MEDRQILEILAFTDPVCTWCWGSEPVLRKLQVGYGGQVRIRPVMGGLVKDIRTFYDRANDIGGDPEGSNASIAAHWLEASEVHGMPVRTDGFRLFTAETVSTYPQNVAYKAAELIDPALAPRYLRRLREASAAEARETGRREVLVELAGEVGLDRSALIGRLADGTAERAFRADLEATRRFGVRGFPTFALCFGGCTRLLRGYQRFQALRAAIERLSEGALQWRTPTPDADGLRDFLRTFGRAAPVELATVFDLAPSDLEPFLAALEAAGTLRRVTAGNGCFWEAGDPFTELGAV
ncbi:putative dithiol-disulfide isomerase involved in polyketide biosynthesis [Thioflavicoccus mobilis 8321]|uniref:Putative dithiol-disulfide isomerase involved in polyketide biosynthesis n=1 Tax=Thioflavicoccus mobilis 8321 TaxID=765912 RepID=L0GV70_9GAMM|nr:thioredoxin [Thioflavicoccus mobilis]AGA89265.1 putative dithiol-disulfide isomerase involved in polyketide biosynthesis [Thioflavicoccus mobilis 8321]